MPASSGTPRPQRNYLLLTALAVVLVIVMLMLLAEGGVRLRQWLKHGQASSVDALLQQDPVSGLRVPRPGVHGGRLHINSLGCRGPELSEGRRALRGGANPERSGWEDDDAEDHRRLPARRRLGPCAGAGWLAGNKRGV